MRGTVVLLAAILLAGCTSPHPLDVRRKVLGDEAVETWTVTIDASGPFVAEVPVPVSAAVPFDRWREAATATGANLTETVREGARLLRIAGEGSVTAHAVLRTGSGSSGYAEQYLGARWTSNLSEARPEQLPLGWDGDGTITVEYTAESAFCGRQAKFAHSSGSDGWVMANGNDEAICT